MAIRAFFVFFILSIYLMCQGGIGKENQAGADVMTERATFAAGCFWCIQPPFDKLEGVVSTTVGYAGGDELNPTYRQVSNGLTGHAEAIEIEYDPAQISYKKLLDVFWQNIDPTQKNRQFCDKGKQYRSAIFYRNEEERESAIASAKEYAKRIRVEGKFYTEIELLKKFYPAEVYHQKFYKKNPRRYYGYRKGCGRDRRLEQLWGK